MDTSRLTKQAGHFAQDVEDLLTSTICQSAEVTALEAKTPNGLAVVIRTAEKREEDPAPCYLTVENKKLLVLEVSYKVLLGRDSSYLRVEQSSFQVKPLKGAPFFRYDYMSRPESMAVPTSHFQIHAHRDEVLHAMYVSAKSRSKGSKKKDLDPDSPRGLQMLHFPLGGARFRPCLEDVIEMLIREFGVDAQLNWEERIKSGRIAWRHIQLAAAVRDDPETARSALREVESSGGATDEARLSRY
ncbi:hypothetical protein ACSL103130_06515 [Actinomyces slackii]|uniref:Uncharacterized protein n=1 Tax=Actinomyces slackii TaxID=52774 RepID=A0A448KG66_9ACTO|nr:hypothetical protein [Actinomyces slackii]VEG75895.1 Uncharacterised protein [Actinomyces slackii]